MQHWAQYGAHGKCSQVDCTPGNWYCIVAEVPYATSTLPTGEELHVIMATAVTSICLRNTDEYGLVLISLAESCKNDHTAEAGLI